jgi:hypothetical protein
MTVEQLIMVLSQFPSDRRVLVLGQEFGLSDVGGVASCRLSFTWCDDPAMGNWISQPPASSRRASGPVRRDGGAIECSPSSAILRCEAHVTETVGDMTSRFRNTLVLADGRRLPVTGEVSHTNVEILTAFRHQAGRLIESPLVARFWDRKPSIAMVINLPTGQAITTVDATEMELNDLLTRLRPFILQKEPTHFGTAKNIVARLIDQPEFKAWLKQLSTYFFGRQEPQMSIKYDGTTITTEEFLFRWLNSTVFHVNFAEQKEVGAVLGSMAPALWKTAFFQMLFTKTVCIARLGGVIGDLSNGRDIEVDPSPPVVMRHGPMDDLARQLMTTRP